jgi:hypothetical protein
MSTNTLLGVALVIAAIGDIVLLNRVGDRLAVPAWRTMALVASVMLIAGALLIRGTIQVLD